MSQQQQDRRWVRGKHVAEHLGVTPMSIHRWRNDPELKFPKPSDVRGIPYWNLNEIDAWMKSRVVDRTKKREVA